MLSVAHTKRVPSCTPAAPISRKARIASPRPMPPATNTGTSIMCGRISCASTLRLTGPICPPASEPSITSASAPARTSRLASDKAGAKHTTLAPPSLARRMAPPGGIPPANTMCPTRAARQASTSASRRGCMVIRFTPKGRSVRAWVPAISSARRSGSMAPLAITPKAPALESAATRLRSLTQLIAPPMTATRAPRNSAPRAISRSSTARAPVDGGASFRIGSASIAAGGAVIPRARPARRRCARPAPPAPCIPRPPARSP